MVSRYCPPLSHILLAISTQSVPQSEALKSLREVVFIQLMRGTFILFFLHKGKEFFGVDEIKCMRVHVNVRCTCGYTISQYSLGT